jgi:hypothetical protein
VNRDVVARPADVSPRADEEASSFQVLGDEPLCRVPFPGSVDLDQPQELEDDQDQDHDDQQRQDRHRFGETK